MTAHGGAQGRDGRWAGAPGQDGRRAGAPGGDGRWVGAAITRKEDGRLLQGRGRFVGDMTRTGMLHAAFARSPFPAAAVTGVDTTAARQAPGVAAVFTAADLGDPYLLATLDRDEFVPTPMPLLAGDQVRFAREPVAVVLAGDAYLAEDAAELVDVDWAPGRPSRASPLRGPTMPLRCTRGPAAIALWIC